MALPKLNQAPSYELIIPSTGEKLEYRPFLVKEQKILLMALETQDQKMIFKSIFDTLVACVSNNKNLNKLKTFDVEFIFLQMRSKAVGETTDLALKCLNEECAVDNPIKIPFTGLAPIIDKDITNKIAIGDEYSLNLEYPTFLQVANMDYDEDKPAGTNASDIFETALLCLHSLDTEDEKVFFKDESKEEAEEFMGSLTAKQFESIITFAETIPIIKYDAKIKCPKCNNENEYNLRGMQDFFL